jgi:gamma-glutamylcyclotransferase (GGCT)/AIG2-like uncharacterized protein YtfP
MAERLFVYGTLHPDRAPKEIADIVSRFRHVGYGTIRGVRYELDDYPAVVLKSRSAEEIPGEIFVLPSDSSALARLDEYEEYQPDDPAHSLFRRMKTAVTFDDGTQQECWVYAYNGPLPKTRARSRIAA